MPRPIPLPPPVTTATAPSTLHRSDARRGSEPLTAELREVEGAALQLTTSEGGYLGSCPASIGRRNSSGSVLVVDLDPRDGERARHGLTARVDPQRVPNLVTGSMSFGVMWACSPSWPSIVAVSK